MRTALFVITCVCAAGVPFFCAPPAQCTPIEFPGWPLEFEGRALKSLPLLKYEKQFEADFPGRIGRFSDGEREIVIRYIAEKTRKLHPSSDCFKACGYSVQQLPLWSDAQGIWWGHYRAVRQDEELFIYERIYDLSDGNWTDTSAWYWAALLGQTQRPWWSITIAEKTERSK